MPSLATPCLHNRQDLRARKVAAAARLQALQAQQMAAASMTLQLISRCVGGAGCRRGDGGRVQGQGQGRQREEVGAGGARALLVLPCVVCMRRVVGNLGRVRERTGGASVGAALAPTSPCVTSTFI